MSRRHEVEQRGRRFAGDDTRERLLAGTPVTERRLDPAGVSAAVLEGGDGSRVVLLHGGIECGGVYRVPVISGLAENHRLVVPVLRRLVLCGAPGTGPTACHWDSWWRRSGSA